MATRARDILRDIPKEPVHFRDWTRGENRQFDPSDLAEGQSRRLQNLDHTANPGRIIAARKDTKLNVPLDTTGNSYAKNPASCDLIWPFRGQDGVDYLLVYEHTRKTLHLVYDPYGGASPLDMVDEDFSANSFWNLSGPPGYQLKDLFPLDLSYTPHLVVDPRAIRIYGNVQSPIENVLLDEDFSSGSGAAGSWVPTGWTRFNYQNTGGNAKSYHRTGEGPGGSDAFEMTPDSGGSGLNTVSGISKQITVSGFKRDDQIVLRFKTKPKDTGYPTSTKGTGWLTRYCGFAIVAEINSTTGDEYYFGWNAGQQAWRYIGRAPGSGNRFDHVNLDTEWYKLLYLNNQITGYNRYAYLSNAWRYGGNSGGWQAPGTNEDIWPHTTAMTDTVMSGSVGAIGASVEDWETVEMVIPAQSLLYTFGNTPINGLESFPTSAGGNSTFDPSDLAGASITGFWVLVTSDSHQGGFDSIAQNVRNYFADLQVLTRKQNLAISNNILTASSKRWRLHDGWMEVDYKQNMFPAVPYPYMGLHYGRSTGIDQDYNSPHRNAVQIHGMPVAGGSLTKNAVYVYGVCFRYDDGQYSSIILPQDEETTANIEVTDFTAASKAASTHQSVRCDVYVSECNLRNVSSVLVFRKKLYDQDNTAPRTVLTSDDENWYLVHTYTIQDGDWWDDNQVASTAGTDGCRFQFTDKTGIPLDTFESITGLSTTVFELGARTDGSVEWDRGRTHAPAALMCHDGSQDDARHVYSLPGRPDTFDPYGYIKVPRARGLKLIAATITGDILLVWTRQTTHAFNVASGSDLQWIPVGSFDHGIIHDRAFMDTKAGAFWLSDIGLIRFNSEGIENVSDSKMKDDLLVNLSQFDDLVNGSYPAAMTYDPYWGNIFIVLQERYGFANNDECFVYNIFYDSWRYKVEVGSGTPATYTGVSYKHGGTNVNGRLVATRIDETAGTSARTPHLVEDTDLVAGDGCWFDWRGPFFSLGDFKKRKKAYRIFLKGYVLRDHVDDDAVIQLEFYRDDDESTAAWSEKFTVPDGCQAGRLFEIERKVGQKFRTGQVRVLAPDNNVKVPEVFYISEAGMSSRSKALK